MRLDVASRFLGTKLLGGLQLYFTSWGIALKDAGLGLRVEDGGECKI